MCFQYGNSILRCVRCLSIQTLSVLPSSENKTPDFYQGERGKLPNGMELKGQLSSNCFYPVFFILVFIFLLNLYPHLVTNPVSTWGFSISPSSYWSLVHH